MTLRYRKKQTFPKRTLLRSIMPVIVVALIGIGCAEETVTNNETPQEKKDLRIRFGLKTLGAIQYPPDNPPRQERISLGRLIFFDPILSGEKDMSCGTCHHPSLAFTDRRQFGAGVSGTGLGPDRVITVSAVSGLPIKFEGRHTIGILNSGFNEDENNTPTVRGFLVWDGKFRGLEAQVTEPIATRVEMRGDAYPGTEDQAAADALDSVLARFKSIPEYVLRFRAAFPEEALQVDLGTREHIVDSSTFVRSVAAYERELVANHSAYDRYVRGDDNALSNRQKEGLELFFTKAKCGSCHGGPMFSNFKFVVQGVPQEGEGTSILPGDDTGREEVTKSSADRYMFRVPTLRNVELTPPYMHDGVFESLEEVMQFYNNGALPRHPGVTDAMLDPILRAPLGLTDDEIGAIIDFMNSLTDPGINLPRFLVTVPERVPSGLTPVFGVGDGGSGVSEKVGTAIVK